MENGILLGLKRIKEISKKKKKANKNRIICEEKQYQNNNRWDYGNCD